MKITKLSGCLVKITTEVSAEELTQFVDEAFKEVQKDLEVTGFRKGHVPRKIYQEKFGDESLLEDAINIALNKKYYEALTEKKIMPLADPEIDLDHKSVKLGSGFKLAFTIQVWPEVTLGAYKGVEVKKDSTKVTAKEVDEAVKRNLERSAELVLVEEGELAVGHTAVFDFEGYKDGEKFEGGSAENFTLEIGSGQFIPGFEDQMVGMKPESEKTIAVTFPQEYHEASLAGAPVEFKVKLHEIKEKVIPPLSDAFVKEQEIEGVTTCEEYKKHIKAGLEKEKAEASENKFKDDVINLVTDNAKFDLPEALIDDEINYYVSQFEAQAKTYQMPVETLLQLYGIQDLEQYKETLRPGAEKIARQRVVLVEIAKAEKLELSDEKYEAEMKKVAEAQKTELEAVKKEYPKQAVAQFFAPQLAAEFVLAHAKAV